MGYDSINDGRSATFRRSQTIYQVPKITIRIEVNSAENKIAQFVSSLGIILSLLGRRLVSISMYRDTELKLRAHLLVNLWFF